MTDDTSMTDHIFEFWEGQAERHGVSHAASWGDSHAMELEIETIGRFIAEGEAVLDVGCANGFSTLRHLDRGAASITGVDFSPRMVDRARQAWRQAGSPAHVRFEEADVRGLPFESETFDLVYTTRTLINLPTWAEQQQGIEECLRVCRQSGTVVLSEAFWEPLVLLNALRALKSLEPLVEHDFNRYLKKSVLERYLEAKGIQFEVVEFSSVYYLGSRFVRELVTNPDDYAGYSNPVNRAFYELELEYSGGGFGIQQAYVLRRSS